MTELKPGRIPCIGRGTGCRRTGSADKYGPYTEIVCGKCWHRVPPRLRNRYKRLNREARRLKRRMHPDEMRLRRIDQLHDMNWLAIRRSLNQPSKPVGLDTFLAESGL